MHGASPLSPRWYQCCVRFAQNAPKGSSVDVPGSRKLATRLRDHLRLAGVTREDLFIDERSRKPMTFHDLRATGINWMALRGDEPIKIMHRAGHRGFTTTQIYVCEAEVFERARSTLSLPFFTRSRAQSSQSSVSMPARRLIIQWRRRESNFEHASRSTVGRVSGFSDFGVATLR